MYYNVHRWYQYGTGRYGRVDPLRFLVAPAELSLAVSGVATSYSYVRGQTLYSTDSLGLEETNDDRLRCILNPRQCYRVNDCKQEATDAERRKSGSNTRNSPGDASRHCYWSCCIAKAIGAESAEDWGNGHEIFLGNPLCEKQMDLFNNRQGRGLGPNGPTTSCETHCSTTPLQTEKGPDCCPAPHYTDSHPGETPRVVP